MRRLAFDFDKPVQFLDSPLGGLFWFLKSSLRSQMFRYFDEHYVIGSCTRMDVWWNYPESAIFRIFLHKAKNLKNTNHSFNNLSLRIND